MSTINPDGEYLDTVVTPRTVETAEVKAAGVVLPGATSYRENHPEKRDHYMEAQIKAERSKLVRLEGGNNDAPNKQKHNKAFFCGGIAQKNERPRSFSPDWFFCTIAAMTLVFLALVGYGFGSGLFLPSNTTMRNPNNAKAKGDAAAPGIGGSEAPSDPSSQATFVSETLVNRQDYNYNIVTMLGLPPVMERTSPQARALEWLAFEDEPLFDPQTIAPKDRDSQRDPLAQRYALVVWYFDQGGPTVWKTLNREVSSGWIEFGAGVHECNWRGVDCDYYDENNNAGTVVGLRLSPVLGLLLTGSSLSTELGLLTGLRRMDFSDQRLRGMIPNEWSALTNLEMVVLSKNEIQTTIPEWIGGWTNLEHLALDGNLLYGTIPSSFATLQNLKHLELHTNSQLRGRFDDVLFSPSSNINATTTTTTTVKGGPKYTLEYLDLSNTNLEGELPQTTLPSLRSLRLWNTRGFGGTLPTEIGSWSNLETFSIKESPNLFGSIPTEFGLLENLQTLEVQDSNNMSGELPSELGYLSSNLKVINFRYTNKTGSLPVEWSNLKSLEHMDLVQNDRLQGTVPPEYSRLTNLRFLDLRGTYLSGTVPDGVCALEKLEEFLADCITSNDKTDGKIVCVCCTWCNNS